MKALHLLAMSAAMAPLLILAAARADAQQPPVAGGRPFVPPPSPSQGRMGGMHGMHGSRHFSRGFFIYQDYAPVYVHDDAQDDTPPPAAVPPPPPPAPRKPYVIGRSYSSLPPDGCLKLIQDGSSYYGCSGEWYRQVGVGYKAVAQP